MARILIVDDERSIRRTLREFLSAEGYQVAEAEDADAALHQLRGGEFDVVFSDIVLPRVSGVELLQRIQAVAPHVAVVMMTGEPTAETAAQSIRAGAVDYLFKPITKEVILRTAGHASRLKRLEDDQRRLEAENRAHRENLERLVAERTAALRESEARFRGLYENAPMGLYRTTPEGEILLANPALVRMLGHQSFQDLVEQDLETQGFHPDYPRSQFKQTLETHGELHGLESAWTRSDGTKVYVRESARAVRDDAGKVVYYDGVVEDVTERKLAEDAVRESQALYQALVEQLPQCVFRKDCEGRFTFVNRRFAELAGKPPEAIVGKNDFDLFDRALAEKYRADDASVLKSGSTRTVIERHRPPGACEDRIVEVVKWPVHTAEGQVAGIQGIFWDVTEREKAAEAIRLSEHRLKQAERLAHLGSWESELGQSGENSRGGMVWSDETFRIFGHEPGSIAINYERFLEHVHPEDRAAVQKAAAITLQTGRPYCLEHRIVRPDGSVRVVLEQAEVVREPAAERAVRLLGTVLDVTEQRRSEGQLHKLALAVDQSPVTIMITDRAGNLEFVNPRFTQVTGYASEEVLGQNPRFLKSGEHTEEEYRHLWETILTGGEWRGVFRNKRKDGTLVWESASISPLRDASGAITHFMAIKEDLTEKREMEARLLRAQRVESLGSLTGGIAHDLNNILSPILMCASLLRAEDSPVSRQELAQTIEASAQRAVGIVKQLLSFARGKGGSRSVLEVRYLVHEMVKIVSETFPRSIQVSEHYDKGLWPIIADPTQIQQVLLNLCVNARDAMPAGGHLTLSSENVVLDEQYASMKSSITPGPYVRIEVRDTGVGIPEEHQVHIFQSFFTTKPEGVGTGLGLATVKGIVQNHGGTISFTSVPGKGTSFVIHLPARPESPAETQTAPSRPTIPRGQGEWVLLADDEVSIRGTMRRTLERFGYRVLEAQNGVEALAEFINHRDEVRAVVTDVVMPLMDGVTLSRSLRALSPQIPIIVSGGGLLDASGREAVRTFEEMGLRHLLQKPHTAEVLLQALAEEMHPELSTNRPGGHLESNA